MSEYTITQRMTNWLRQHPWCILIMLGIVLVSLLTAWLTDSASLSHVSFASAILSIALSVIVIVFTLIQSDSSARNLTRMTDSITEMRHLISEASDQSRQTRQVVESHIQELITETPAHREQPPTAGKIRDLETHELDLNAYPALGILVLYAIAKSHQAQKPLSLKALSSELIVLFEQGQVGELYAYSAGVFQALRSVLGIDSLIFRRKEQKVVALPNGFGKRIDEEIAHRLADQYTEPGKTLLNTGKNIIDSHYNQGEEPA